MASDRTERRGGTGAGAPGSVALFIDWDNFAIGLRQEMPDRPADVGPILRWSRRFGVLSVVRAYGEWREPSERLAIYNAGVEVVYAPVLPLGGSVQARAGAGGAKSLADTAMAVDVTDALNLMPSITTVILATSDKDLIPVLRFAQRRGLHAVVVGSDRTAGALRDLADEFISYRQLLDSEMPTGAQSRPAMVPPVRYPRAPRPEPRPEGTRALPPPDRDRDRPRGRFEPRSGSVVVPLDRGASQPLSGSAIVASPAGVTGIAEPNPVDSTISTPGSIFADGEDQAGGDAAARRRRRGGRRRRGREVMGEGEGAPPDDAADADDEADSALADPVSVNVGDVAARGPEAVSDAASMDAADDDESIVRPAPARVDPIPSPVRRVEAPPRGAPVVLPGERLRRLASQPAPAPAPEPESREPAAEAAPAEDAESDAAPRARGRRGGTGRTRVSAAKSEPVDSSSGDSASADEETEAGETGEAADEPEADASGTGRVRTPSRGRRRGGRGR